MPVMPSAQGALFSPKRRIMVSATRSAPPEISRIAPNIDPSPTNKAMPLRVSPIPLLTVSTIIDTGIPEISPIPKAEIKMAIKG